ncbi:MAG TPA: organic hydroperoxide resistance protein [Schlesneria sp.]|jgi:Ohr subfamily peroxiredoxin
MSTTQASQKPQPVEHNRVIYTAEAHTTDGRDGGASHTSDGRLDVKLSLPGEPGNGTNPEQLFAVGWSACFISAMGIAATQRKLALSPLTAIDAAVNLCTGPDGYSLQARFKISVPDLEREVAQEIVDAAEQLCPYSKATRGNIDVEFNLV